jgi:hypothetical protein
MLSWSCPSQREALAVTAVTRPSGSNTTRPDASGLASSPAAIANRLLRRPAARCGPSRARKSASRSSKSGRRDFRYRPSAPQQAPSTTCEARSSASLPLGCSNSR